MSYILDALKKSEKQRQRGTVPDLLTVQDTLAQEPKKRPLWPYLLIVALLLNTCILILWLGPWQSKKPSIVVQSSGGQHRSNTLESVHEVSDVRPTVMDSSPDPAKTASPKTAEKSVKIVREDQPLRGKSDISEAIGVSPSVPLQSHEVSHVPSEPKPDNNIMAAVENKVYDLKGLPLSIQQSLPAFAISVAVYSNDPTSRMVKINGQLMREGQYLTAGLKLEEISPDGVIFSYQNYRFRVGMK